MTKAPQRFLTSYHYLPIWEVIFSQSENSKFSSSTHRMSSTPPKKGKKRAPPSTPTGRPPAKASRASTPTASTGGDAPRGFASTIDPSATPAIPPLRSTTGGSQVLATGPTDFFSPHGCDSAMDDSTEEGPSTLPAD